MGRFAPAVSGRDLLDVIVQLPQLMNRQNHGRLSTYLRTPNGRQLRSCGNAGYDLIGGQNAGRLAIKRKCETVEIYGGSALLGRMDKGE
ncbi:unnamed protein product [Protopolystoma xenopodis]|uniref:Uncharacterized protein n=1 Tax=Protopolystoma xenopodis TaxID=117903 RepID=A0A3S5FD49_9PLAT|nr:unnamed protein product [Protopolystoma xenopodis]